MYEVYLERTAERDLKKLQPQKFHRVIQIIKSLAEDPRPHGCRKISGSQNDWRIRVGDYRIIYEILDKTNTVNVMRVRHRREAY